MHKTSQRFRKALKSLPINIRKLANKNFIILKSDPKHPSLHFKKIGTIWSVRIGINYRAIAVEEGEDFIWIWIGNHSEYEELLKNQPIKKN